jgi:lysophospholipase L1-like esterase
MRSPLLSPTSFRSRLLPLLLTSLPLLAALLLGCAGNNTPTGEGGVSSLGGSSSATELLSSGVALSADVGLSSAGAILSSALVDVVCAEGTDTVRVAPNNPAIAYDGVWYPEVDSLQATLVRHSPECMLNAECMPGWLKPYGLHKQHPGVVIRFRTSATGIRLLMEENPVTPEASRRYPFMKVGVYIDGQPDGPRSPIVRITDGVSATYIPGGDGVTVRTYEIVLPHQLAVIFHGLLLTSGGCLQPVAPLNKPVYVSLGDSQTHGEGQMASYEGFAWQVARAKGWELVNLAIGGTTISPKMAELNFPGKRIDVVSVEWGYNDWASEYFNLADGTANYALLLETIRASHPVARIYCIAPFTTTTVRGNNSTVDGQAADGSTIAQWRDMMRQAVATRTAAGDSNIFFIDGSEISTTADLTTDGIHMTTAGAAHVAAGLIERMSL